jgi:hypothetical protein
LNAAVRVKTGSIVTVVIVAAGVLIAVVAWLVRPPPPSVDGPTTRPASSVPAAR